MALMLLPLLAAMAVNPPIDQPVRLRKQLANGSVVLVEPDFTQPSITLVLGASSRGGEDTPSTHGYRHLLEHLLAKGRRGDLDQRLESAGGLLRATTYRDATLFEVIVPPDKLELGLDILAELLRPPKLTPEMITGELRILKQELILEDPISRLARAGWNRCYPDNGLDPLGTIAPMSNADPLSMLDLYDRSWAAANLIAVVHGPVVLDDGMRRLSALLSRVPGGSKPASYAARIPGQPQRIRTEDGEAVAMPVGPYKTSGTAAMLAAGLLIATELKSAFVTYTLSARPGCVVVGVEGKQADTAVALAKLGAADFASWWPSAQPFARAWLRRQMAGSDGTRLRALLLAQAADETPERFEKAIDDVRSDEFVAACGSIKAAWSK